MQQRQAGNSSPTVVSVSSLNPSQLSAMRLNMTGQPSSNVVAKTIPVGTVVTAGAGKPGSSQIQFYRQPMRQQLKVMHATAGQGGTVVQSGQTTALVGPGGIVTNIQNLQGQTVQVQSGQKVVASGSGGTNVQTVATVQMAGQPRAQFVKPVGGKQITRGEAGEMQAVMVKRPLIGHKQMLPQAQLFSNVQMQQGGSQPQQITTLVKTSGGVTSSVPLTQVKTAQLKTTQVNAAQVRQIQLHQPLQIAQQRKGGKVTQITQLGKTTLPTQLIVQNSKTIPGTVTVQQLQPMFRHANPGQLAAAGQIMLGKNVGRMIPVSVAQQPNQRQTIQVVTGNPGVRAHVATSQSFQGVLQGAIKVAAPQQQAILTALQNTNQRSNASPIRLQNAGGSLVAVTVQQSPNQANQVPVSVTEVTSNNPGTSTQANSGQQTQQSPANQPK